MQMNTTKRRENRDKLHNWNNKYYQVVIVVSKNCIESIIIITLITKCLFHSAGNTALLQNTGAPLCKSYINGYCLSGSKQKEVVAWLRSPAGPPPIF